MNIPFVDLKAQYLRSESDINTAIKEVLNHGRFILGPEVKEFEAAFGKSSGKYSISNLQYSFAMALHYSSHQFNDQTRRKTIGPQFLGHRFIKYVFQMSPLTGSFSS